VNVIVMAYNQIYNQIWVRPSVLADGIDFYTYGEDQCVDLSLSENIWKRIFQPIDDVIVVEIQKRLVMKMVIDRNY
jgi:hypothetical protein